MAVAVEGRREKSDRMAFDGLDHGKVRSEAYRFIMKYQQLLFLARAGCRERASLGS